VPSVVAERVGGQAPAAGYHRHVTLVYPTHNTAGRQASRPVESALAFQSLNRSRKAEAGEESRRHESGHVGEGVAAERDHVQYGGREPLLLGAPEVAAERELAARAGGKMPPKVRRRRSSFPRNESGKSFLCLRYARGVVVSSSASEIPR
jgi:hypothetical protein